MVKLPIFLLHQRGFRVFGFKRRNWPAAQRSWRIQLERGKYTGGVKFACFLEDRAQVADGTVLAFIAAG